MNPYLSPAGEVPKPWFSGFPRWMRTIIKIVLIVNLTLATFSFYACYKYRDSASTYYAQKNVVSRILRDVERVFKGE